jgi:hypothetical protein
MKAFGIRPKRDLGQNFLIDSNILDVIARAAELREADVVLEVGGRASTAASCSSTISAAEPSTSRCWR